MEYRGGYCREIISRHRAGAGKCCNRATDKREGKCFLHTKAAKKKRRAALIARQTKRLDLQVSGLQAGTFYLHTLDGRPAFFSKGSQAICFAGCFGPANPLAHSLAQIRREQAISMKTRGPDDFSCGYVRVKT